jgi:hypothetical protein
MMGEPSVNLGFLIRLAHFAVCFESLGLFIRLEGLKYLEDRMCTGTSQTQHP